MYYVLEIWDRRLSGDTHGCHGPSLATVEASVLQAWNCRVKGKLIDEGMQQLEPISKMLYVRTEFSGAGTAEESICAAVQMYNSEKIMSDHIKVEFQSSADWDHAARQCAKQNRPNTCCFGDIMGMVPQTLRDRLEAEVQEKAIFICQTKCNNFRWHI